MSGRRETLLLVDASSSVFRAFYALPPLRTATGIPTNAALGFTTMLQKVLRERAPDYVVIVWDAPGPKRRTEVFADYKATRDRAPEDLRDQFPSIRQIVDAYRLESMEYPGEEADDVIATLARLGRRAGVDVTIVSTDRDLMQLVDPHVRLLDTMKDREFGPDEVEARFGVPPEQMLDFRALTGDSSDNIPGVKGIGEKGAAKLIRTYGSLDAVLEHAEEISAKRQREALVAGRDAALLSRELSRLREDLPLELSLDRCRVEAADEARLRQLFTELEFKRLLDDLGAGEGSPASAAASPARADVSISCIRDASALVDWVEKLGPARTIGLALVLEPASGMRGALVGCALAADRAAAGYVDVQAIGEETFLECAGPFLGDPSRSFIGEDLKSAWLALARRGVDVSGTLADVSVLGYIADSSQNVVRAEALAKRYLNATVPGGDDTFGRGAKRRPLDAVPTDELATFFGGRAALALELDPAIRETLPNVEQAELISALELPLVRVLARMELAGVRIDEEALEALDREIIGALEGLEQTVYAEAGETFNIGSPKQLQRILFEKLQLPPSKKTKTGFSTDESVLEELSLRYPIASAILEVRKLTKLKSTYVEALPKLVHPETGRIHCSFNQTVAATGRISASNPNLQNIPIRTPFGARIREAFIPAEGRILLSADYSQIELRILAHFSGDEALVEAFRGGADIHRETASRVFDVDIADVTPQQRDQMKAVNFGIIYGSSAFGLARQLGISQSVAAEFIQAYFARYPGVRRFLDETIERAKAAGYVETLLGRRRYLPDLSSRNRVMRAAAERMATNSVIQGTAADLIKRAMVSIDAALCAADAPRAQMILQVHDELVFEVSPDDLDALRDLVVPHMQDVAELSVPILVHVGHGASWRDAH